MESGFVKYEFSVLQMRDPGVESGGAATTPSLEGELKGVRGDGSAGATTTPSLEGESKGVKGAGSWKLEAGSSERRAVVRPRPPL